ncbi:hypothetical protein EU537_05265 [Candidatus Thorarchaeota archaeon]|nr:MAG: hypothetical protein EU537_05265 [Candidatus Thorarchaeota archaeon]
MDFQLSIEFGAIVAIIILAGSLVKYSSSVLSVRKRVSGSTLKALVFFGASGAALGGLTFTSTLSAGTIAARFWIVLFFVFLINAQVQIATENRYAHYGTYLVAIVATTWSAIVALGSPTEVSPVLGLALYITFSVSLMLSLWLLYESPSPFTAGMLLILLSFLGSWFAIITELIFARPEYFLLVFLPVALSAAILRAMLQPWKQIITSFAGFMAIIVATALIPAAIISNQFEIWLFVLLSTFVALAAIGSIDFFVEQALETRARIPALITITLICISMIAVNHGVFWSVLIETGLQDEPMLFIEWILGVAGASSFVLAGIYSLSSPSGRRIARHILVIFSGAMIVLGNDYVRMGRWVYNDLFLILSVALGIGAIAYLRVAKQLMESGATNAARNFIAFMFAALGSSIVTIASDDLPFWLSIALLALTGIMLIYSSPRRLAAQG